MILEVRGTSRRPNTLVDDDNVPEDIDEITFDHRGHDDRDKDHEGKESQEPVPVRMSDIVPRTANEEAWRSMYVTRRLIIQYGETPGCPGCESIGKKNGPSHSTECRQWLQNEMSTTSEGKIKLDEEQKRRDAFTARRMMTASHTPVTDGAGHDGQARSSKRARTTSEIDIPTPPSCMTSRRKDHRGWSQRARQT